MVFYKKLKFDSKAVIEFGIWSIWIATFFLPQMHDRYFYMASLLSICYLFLHTDKIYFPIVMECIMFYCYYYYLFGAVGIPIQLVSTIHLGVFLLYSMDMYKRYFAQEPKKLEKEEQA